MLAHNDQSQRTETFFVVLKLSKLVLLWIARFIEWIIKFLLQFILYFITVLEAMVVVVLQLLKVIKDIIKVLFTFGTLLYHVGYNIGVFGTVVLILGLCTYVFKLKPNLYVDYVQAELSSTSIDIINKVLIAIWVVMVPITLLYVYLLLKMRLSLLIKSITTQEISRESNYGELCVCGKTYIRYVDKGTETDANTEYDIEEPSASTEQNIRKGVQDTSGLEHGDKETSEVDRRRRKDRRVFRKDLSREENDVGKRIETASDDNADSSDGRGRGLGRGKRKGRGKKK